MWVHLRYPRTSPSAGDGLFSFGQRGPKIESILVEAVENIWKMIINFPSLVWLKVKNYNLPRTLLLVLSFFSS